MTFRVIAGTFAAGASGQIETAGTVATARTVGQSSPREPFGTLRILPVLGAFFWPAIIFGGAVASPSACSASCASHMVDPAAVVPPAAAAPAVPAKALETRKAAPRLRSA
jgi:hypothetical protein